jgi:hypothetical protein
MEGKFFPQHLSVMCGRKGDRYGSRRFPPRYQCWRAQDVSPKHPSKRTERLRCCECRCRRNVYRSKPGLNRAKFRAEVLRQLPFEAEVVLCDGRDLIGLEMENPFGTEPSRPDIVRFVSILSRPGRSPADIPCNLPPRGEWFVRVIASKKRYVFGVYRRHMRTIGYLGQIDKMFGVPATTRNWNTILAVVRILKGQEKKVAD